MDIAGTWRSMRADAPHVGAHVETAGDHDRRHTGMPGCVALGEHFGLIPEVTVIVTSHGTGVAAQVPIGANLNSPDGSYRGPRQRSAKVSSPPRVGRSTPVSLSAFRYLSSALVRGHMGGWCA